MAKKMVGIALIIVALLTGLLGIKSGMSNNKIALLSVSPSK